MSTTISLKPEKGKVEREIERTFFLIGSFYFLLGLDKQLNYGEEAKTVVERCSNVGEKLNNNNKDGNNICSTNDGDGMISDQKVICLFSVEFPLKKGLFRSSYSKKIWKSFPLLTIFFLSFSQI